MNELLGMRFLRLLSETSQEVTNEEMQNVYEEFLEYIENVSNGTDSVSYTHRFKFLICIHEKRA